MPRRRRRKINRTVMGQRIPLELRTEANSIQDVLLMKLGKKITMLDAYRIILRRSRRSNK